MTTMHIGNQDDCLERRLARLDALAAQAPEHAIGRAPWLAQLATAAPHAMQAAVATKEANRVLNA